MNLSIELRYSARRLLRAPGFSLATVLMLTLGVAICVCMFSMLRGVLLAGLPYPGGERVVSVGSINPRQQNDRGQLTPAEAELLAAGGESRQSPFEQFGYFNWGGITVFDADRPREATIVAVSPGFFPALGLQPQLGRWFSGEEHQAHKGTVILSFEEWQRLLGGRSDAIGQTIDSSEGRLRVVGVMPREFQYPAPNVGAWIPRSTYNATLPAYQNARYVFGIGRLQAQLGAAAVQARLDALAAEVRRRFSQADSGWRITSTSVLEQLVGDLRGTLWSAFAIAMLVLLIACANVAILFDARQIARRQERSLAQALGASPTRIWRGQLLEVALLAGCGVLLGVLTARAGLAALREWTMDSLPRADAIALDPLVLGFALALGLLIPLAVAAAGALRNPSSAAQGLRGAGKGLLGTSDRGRRLLPALAIAFSTVALTAAAAFGSSLIRLHDVNPGFRAQDIHAMQLYRAADHEAWTSFEIQVREKLAALPGVTAVAMTSAAPLSNNGSMSVDLQLQGQTQAEPFSVGLRRVSPEYLRLLGIPLLGGRDIAESDRNGAELVALINRELARRSFGSTSPIGQTIGLPLGQGDRVNYRIVGVMDDIRNDGLRSPPTPEILIPFAQAPWASMTFLVRSQGADDGIAAQMAQAVWAIDPRQAITRQFALNEDLDAQLQTVRFFSRTVGAFGACALLLGAFGVYAVAALQQRHRVREFGLRLAVGARPALLGLQILRDGLQVVVLGALFGLIGAWAALRMIAAQMFGLEQHLAGVMLAAVATVALAALLALLFPALRAARTDPMTALRHE